MGRKESNQTNKSKLCDVTKPKIWPLPLQSIYKYANTHNFYVF